MIKRPFYCIIYFLPPYSLGSFFKYFYEKINYSIFFLYFHLFKQFFLYSLIRNHYNFKIRFVSSFKYNPKQLKYLKKYSNLNVSQDIWLNLRLGIFLLNKSKNWYGSNVT